MHMGTLAAIQMTDGLRHRLDDDEDANPAPCWHDASSVHPFTNRE
jgi:hypothetical protein